MQVNEVLVATTNCFKRSRDKVRVNSSEEYLYHSLSAIFWGQYACTDKVLTLLVIRADCMCMYWLLSEFSMCQKYVA